MRYMLDDELYKRFHCMEPYHWIHRQYDLFQWWKGMPLDNLVNNHGSMSDGTSDFGLEYTDNNEYIYQFDEDVYIDDWHR